VKRIRQFINHSDVERFRFWFQIAAFAFLLYGGYLAIDLGNSVPTFACPFADKTGGTCYLYPLQHQMSMPVKDLFGFRGVAVLTGLATFLGFFLLFNKVWCGFACPLGTIQDWISRCRQRLRIRYGRYSNGTFRVLKKIKYVLLVLLIALPLLMGNSLFGLPMLSHDFATPYCMVCPSRTLLPLFSADAGQLAIDFSSKTKMVLTALGMAVTGLFLAGAFLKKRFFCFFCPMSAFQYLFSKLALMRLAKRGEKCTRCGNCYQVCDVGIQAIADDVVSRNILKDDCMMCLKCIGSCPEEGCLELSFLGIPLYESTQEGFFRRTERKITGERGKS
jgi:polyferredoxin